MEDGLVVIKPEDLKTKLLGFSELKKTKVRQSIGLFHNDEKIYLKLPKMQTPFGISSFNNKYKKTLDLTIEDETLLKKINKLDKYILKQAKINSIDWFGEEKTEEELEEMYTRCVRQSGKYLPTFRQKCLQTYRGDYSFALFDHENNQIDLSTSDPENYIKRTDIISCVVHIVGIWFMNTDLGDKKFGLDIRAFQMKKHPRPKSNTVLTTFALEDSD